jgi:hypothetical protein
MEEDGGRKEEEGEGRVREGEGRKVKEEDGTAFGLY